MNKVGSQRQRSSRFIVRLNWVDLISLSGLGFALFSLQLILERSFDLAMAMLLIAMAIDFADGALARRFSLCREFGASLDGCIDVLDYLIAPTLFLYLSGLDSFTSKLCLACLVSSGVVRLSVFNEVGIVTGRNGKPAYLGMPVYWILFLLAAFQAMTWLVPVEFLIIPMQVILLALSLLMVWKETFFKFQRWQYVSGGLVLAALLFCLHGTGAISNTRSVGAQLSELHEAG